VKKIIVLYITWALLMPTIGYTEEKVYTNSTCPDALETCKALVYQQDQSIKLLKEEVDNLEDRIADDEAKPKLPWWVQLVGGIAIGITAARILK
jgi:hypothetical protein